MIELTVLNFLKEKLGEPVYMEKSEDPPDAYVLIEKTGGSETNYISRATFAVQAYGASLYEAAALSGKVKTLILNELGQLDEISSVKLNAGDYNFTDTTTKHYRYQAVYDVYYYEER